ncbi:hypothetical protein ACAG24_023640 [Mycobacterium sp. pW049]|uniref:TPR repeat region-containing protein n=1 Tax=[Mycobacterium] bulgaricum TaxID=3238985 RepID=UPI00351BB111
MSLTLADLDQWDPDAIHSVFQAATERANGTRSAATGIGDVVAATSWEGKAREAADAASGRVRADLLAHAEECDGVARAAQTAEAQVTDIKADWTNILRMADRWGITINVEAGEISYLPPVTAEDHVEMERRVDILEAEITALLVRANDADENLAAAIRLATGTGTLDELNAELADDPSPFDEEQGNADAQDLLEDGQLSPEAQARLDQATTLAPEQQAALERGDLILPQDQMQYLTAMSRGLDPRTTEEIRAYTRAPGGGALTDAMRLATNPHVASANGARGGLDNAPKALRDIVNDPTLRVPQSTWEQLVQSGGHGFDPRNLFTHWDGMKDMAAILGHGDQALMRGSALDVGMLGKSEEALQLMRTGVWSDATPFHDPMTTDIQTMITASGRDPVAVHDALVTSYDGNGRPVFDNQFLENLTTHRWTDGGTALSNMVTGIPDVATMADPADPTQLAAATRAGETLNAFAQFAGNNPDKLLNIPGTENQSLGQVSPDFTRAMADATVPYLDDMMDNKLDHTTGFRPLAEFSTNPEVESFVDDPAVTATRNLFGVVGTDAFAATTLNSNAYALINDYQDSYVRSIADAAQIANTDDLQSSGALRGVIDTGANLAANDDISDGNAAAQQAWEDKKFWYDAAQKLPVWGDIVDTVGQVPGADNVLQEVILGTGPVPVDAETVAAISPDIARHLLANKFLQLGVGDTSLLDGIRADNGQIVAFGADDVPSSDITKAVDAYLDSIGLKTNTGFDKYEGAYDRVIEGQSQ